MESVADALYIATNAASLADMYKKAEEANEKLAIEKARKNAGPCLNANKMLFRKFPAEKQEIRRILQFVKQDPQQMIPYGQTNTPTQALSAWGGALRDLCRDITQPLGNLIKAHKGGTPLTNYDEGEINKLYKEMSSISNTKDQTEFCEKLNGNQCEALTKRLENWCDRFENLLGDVELGV